MFDCDSKPMSSELEVEPALTSCRLPRKWPTISVQLLTLTRRAYLGRLHIAQSRLIGLTMCHKVSCSAY